MLFEEFIHLEMFICLFVCTAGSYSTIENDIEKARRVIFLFKTCCNFMNGHLGAAATAYLVVTSLILHPSSLVILPQHGSCKITTCKLNMSILPKGNNIMSSKVGIQKRIAVIGGGAAGIITADVMVDSGFAVTVFEQSDAVGGVWDYRSQGEVMLNI